MTLMYVFNGTLAIYIETIVWGKKPCYKFIV